MDGVLLWRDPDSGKRSGHSFSGPGEACGQERTRSCESSTSGLRCWDGEAVYRGRRILNPPYLSAILLWLYLFLATISHGILDAFTDGGLGVAFFAPFVNTRYFFPWTPVEVSPIGSRFFSATGLKVLLNEALWIWTPCLIFAIVMWLRRERRTLN